jgi:hypothetical protein
MSYSTIGAPAEFNGIESLGGDSSKLSLGWYIDETSTILQYEVEG